MNIAWAVILGWGVAAIVFILLASLLVPTFWKRFRRFAMRPLVFVGILGWALLSLAATTQVDLTQNVRGLLPIGNGGTGTASVGTGITRAASGTMTSAEISGDCTTSGSNVLTCQKDNGTTVPVNSAADQALITTASATGGWATLPNGIVQYSTGTHTFSAATVLTGTFADQETPTGLINGANTTFTLAHTPSPAASLTCFENGLAQIAGGADFTLATATITYAVAPATNTTLRCNYRF